MDERTTTLPTFYAVDFFCGAGGTSKGVLQAGGHVLAGVDKVAEYRETFCANNVNPDGSRARFLHMDITARDRDNPAGQRHEVVEALHDLIDPVRDAGVPLMFIICAPCQPFTSVNRGQLTEELEEIRRHDRGLLYHSLAYVREFRPDAVLCENVAGIQDRKFGGVWEHFMNALSDLGYSAGSAVVDTSDYGIPQFRRRSIMLGLRRDRVAPATEAVRDDGSLVVPLFDPDAQPMSVRDAIGHLPVLGAGEVDPIDPDHRASKVSDLNRRRLMAAVEGGNNSSLRETDLAVGCHDRLRDRMGQQGRMSGGYTDSYSRLHGSRPAPTITTKCFSFSNGRFGHYDVAQNRALSIREAACLQSFPEDYRFYTPSITSAAKMVGNAVPPKLAAYFTRYLASAMR